MDAERSRRSRGTLCECVFLTLVPSLRRLGRHHSIPARNISSTATAVHNSGQLPTGSGNPMARVAPMVSTSSTGGTMIVQGGVPRKSPSGSLRMLSAGTITTTTSMTCVSGSPRRLLNASWRTPAVKPRDMPRLIISLPSMRLCIAASAMAEPETPPMSTESAMETCARPPFRRPAITVARLSS